MKDDEMPPAEPTHASVEARFEELYAAYRRTLKLVEEIHDASSNLEQHESTVELEATLRKCVQPLVRVKQAYGFRREEVAEDLPAPRKSGGRRR